MQIFNDRSGCAENMKNTLWLQSNYYKEMRIRMHLIYLWIVHPRANKKLVLDGTKC